ncbi:MAG: DUF3501 family protein [Microthrixaceae bacterium]
MNTQSRKLTLDDIADLREYERRRSETLAGIISLRSGGVPRSVPTYRCCSTTGRRSCPRSTRWFRAERILTDEGLQVQLDTYNPMIPDPGTLSATLLLELTDDDQLREWLPKLVGIETHVLFEFGDHVVRCVVDEAHREQLTREDVTAAVHFIRFEFTPDEVSDWGDGPVVLRIDHPEYDHSTTLSEEMVEELATDLGG